MTIYEYNSFAHCFVLCLNQVFVFISVPMRHLFKWFINLFRKETQTVSILLGFLGELSLLYICQRYDIWFQVHSYCHWNIQKHLSSITRYSLWISHWHLSSSIFPDVTMIQYHIQKGFVKICQKNLPYTVVVIFGLTITVKSKVWNEIVEWTVSLRSMQDQAEDRSELDRIGIVEGMGGKNELKRRREEKRGRSLPSTLNISWDVWFSRDRKERGQRG